MNDLRDSPLTRTPSELKWLLNERAAVLGRIGKARERVDSFGDSVRHYEHLLARAHGRRRAAELVVEEKLRTLQALDISISLVDSRVRPDCAGSVVPWKDKYGARGGLSSFLRETLRLAAPQPVSGAELTRLATEHFKLSLLTPPERRSFRYSVKTALSKAIQRDGVVERLPKPDVWQRSTLFRWKAPTSLDALRALNAAVEASDDSPADAP